MASAGELIFSRDVDSDCDIWDDTALIKAYDEAVSAMKDQLAHRTDRNTDIDLSENLPSSNKKKHKKNRRKHRKKELSNEQPMPNTLTEFKVGSPCRAVFTEDGQLYHAVITSIDHSSGRCRVRYVGYGNEEDQLLIDLLPSGERNDNRRSSILSEGDSVSSKKGHATPKISHHRDPFDLGWQRRTAGSEWMPPPPQPLPSPFFNTGTAFGLPPMMPPLFPPLLGSGMPSFPSRVSPMDMPAPPTVDDEDLLNTDSEALHSMLISWYMSGYHTGYYQGLKQGKKLVKECKVKCMHTEEESEAETAR